MKLYFLGLLLINLLSFRAMSQGSASARPEPTSGIKEALALYDSATVESQHLYNGPQYYFYDSQADEHPFFLTKEWQTGSVFYDGQLFQSVPLLYDAYKDQLVVRYTRGFGNVALQMEKVGHFSLGDHPFIRIVANTAEAGGLRPGFYEVLYGGKSRLLARRTRERLQQIRETKITTLFPNRDAFYVLKNGEYHTVHSRASVLALLEDQKKPLKRYFRQNKLSFRDNREAAIKALVSQYDQLTQP